MTIIKSPLSGNVTQDINPFSWFAKMTNGQFGFININVGRSKAPEVEHEIVQEAASYGRQLGKICAAMEVLARYVPKDAALSEDDRKALDNFSEMITEIKVVKKIARRRYGYEE